jgi:deazaflavin-dependent oxidoreductase (nitroreductase family)
MTAAKFDWQKFKSVQRVHRFIYTIGLGPLVGRIILLLTTTGRRTGLERTTPLQYEEVDGAYLIGSARGQQSDWYRNILADPHVKVRVKSLQFCGLAETVTAPDRIADFLQLRLERHPFIVGQMMKMHDLPPKPSREQLETLAPSLALVVIRPLEETK